MYAESGVPHYWTLDARPGHDRIIARVLEGDTYGVAFESATRIDVAEPVPVAVDFGDLFELRR